MTATTLLGLSARAISAGVRNGEFSARDVTLAHIEWLTQEIAELNALVRPRFEDALREAETVDQRCRAGEGPLPLAGVPISVKESIDMAGTPATTGLTQLAHATSPKDAPVLARLRQAGAIVLGKSNVALLLASFECHNPVYGRTQNPSDPSRTPGGSSGGDAALVAARGVSLGLGTDLGGSLRIPAHFTGTHTLCPTPGRMPTEGLGQLIEMQKAIQGQPGPIAREVADLVLAFEVMTGQPCRMRSGVQGLRILVADRGGPLRPGPAIRRLTQEAGQALAEAGATLLEGEIPGLEEAPALNLACLTGDGGAFMRREAKGSRLDREARRMLAFTRLPKWIRVPLAWGLQRIGQHNLARTARYAGRISVSEYWAILRALRALQDQFQRELQQNQIDAILCPVFPLPAIPYGQSTWLGPIHDLTFHFNLMGAPAGVVSLSTIGPHETTDRTNRWDLAERSAAKTEANSAGLPIGLQVAAQPGQDETVLQVMQALEETKE